MIFKNYKKLIAIIGEEPTTGNSKKAQISELSRYCEWHKEKQKFVIDRVYSKPKVRKDGRAKGKNALYVDNIELQLMYLLSNRPNFTCTYTAKELYETLGMVNLKYYNPDTKKYLIEKDNYTKFDINHFYQRTEQDMQRILFRALRSLKNRCLLALFEEQIVVGTEVQGENGNTHINFQIASDEQQKEIINAQHEVLKDMTDATHILYERITDVYLKFKTDEFYRRLNRKLNLKYGWLCTYKQYKLVYSPENIKRDIPLVSIEYDRNKLNQKILDAVNKQAKLNYLKNIKRLERMRIEYYKETEYGKHVTKAKMFALKDDYVDKQKQLADELIKISKE